MRKTAGLAVILSFALVSGTAYAQGAGRRGGGASSRDIQDLNALVQANLHEVTALSAELPTLRRDRPVIRVWHEMIEQHRSGAKMLAQLDRKLGGSPDTSLPAAEPASGSTQEIVQKTLEAHEETLTKVRGMYREAGARIRPAIRKVEHVVMHHIQMLRSLERHEGRHRGGSASAMNGVNSSQSRNYGHVPGHRRHRGRLAQTGGDPSDLALMGAGLSSLMLAVRRKMAA